MRHDFKGSEGFFETRRVEVIDKWHEISHVALFQLAIFFRCNQSPLKHRHGVDIEFGVLPFEFVSIDHDKLWEDVPGGRK